jgi:nucleotide-binding universal stress UspA family protein
MIDQHHAIDGLSAPPASAGTSRRGFQRGRAAGLTISRILLATDLSTASEKAAGQAIDLARALAAELLVVSVIDPEIRAIVNGLAERMDQRRFAREAAAQALVNRGRQAGVHMSFLVWEGEPGASIVEAAVAESADLVVVGTRGRGRVERMVLGSVSDHVVRHAPCPVLIVRAQAAASRVPNDP